MAWIKRNLFFAIGGVIALLLLGAAGYYDYTSWSHNSAKLDQLNEIYGKLKEFGDEKPSPGNSKIDNIKTAGEQEVEVRDWIDRTGDYFKPIAPIPDSPAVTSEDFAAALRRMVVQLQNEAATASVLLPPNYGFSFEAQRSLVKFAPGSLQPLAIQLGEVKAISEVLFASRVNSLDGIQRARVAVDDDQGPQADYINDVPVTNNLAVLTPYVITFRGFSAELASVLGGFAASPHGLVVKGVNVQPAGAAAQAGAPAPGGFLGMQQSMATAGTKKGGLPTVLNEQLLRITLTIEIVKPLPQK
jgi:hypothetical protein